MDLIQKEATLTLDDDAGAFTAVATSTTLDRDGERMSEKALENVKLARPIPVLNRHDQNEIVGMADRMIYHKGELVASGQMFNEKARKRAKEGIGVSLGFFGEKDGDEFINIEIKEMSLTDSPSNPDARVTRTKSTGDTPLDVTEQLDAFGKELSKLKVVVSDLTDDLTEKNKKTGDDKKPEFVDFSSGRVMIDPARLIQKDYTATESIAGAKQDAVMPFYSKPRNNPFIDLIGRDNIVTVDGDSFAIPQVSGMAFTRRTTRNRAQAPSGDLAEKSVGVRHFENEALFTYAAQDDVPMLREAVLEAYRLELEASIADEVFRVIKAANDDSTAGTITSGATTSTATSYGEADEIITQLATLRQSVPVQFRDVEHTAFVLRGGVIAVLLQAATSAGEWAMDPVVDDMLYLYSMKEWDGFDDASTDGNVVGLFGNFMDSVCVGFTTELEITESLTTNSGYATYYARARFGVGIKDHNAMRTLTVGA